MTEVYSGAQADDTQPVHETNGSGWRAQEDRMLRRGEERDLIEIDTLLRERHTLRELPWHQRLIRIGHQITITSRIAALEQKIRARHTMYGEWSDEEDS